MEFKVGQKVVCINNEIWHNKSLSIHAIGPKYNEIVEIIKIAIKPHGTYLTFKEHRMDYEYNSRQFKPIQYTSLTRELANSFKEVKETSDTPIKELDLSGSKL